MDNIDFERKPDHYVGDYPSVTIHHKGLSPKEESFLIERVEKMLKEFKELNKYGQ